MPTKLFIKIVVCVMLLFATAVVSAAQGKPPKTARDFFELLPPDYFSVYCCDENKDRYVEKYVTVNDAGNGFMEGADTEEDPQYRGFKLKLFPVQKGRTILGLYSRGVRWDDYYFLEYKNGELVNVSKTIPNYSQDNIYDFPRAGSTVKVYKKKYTSPTKEINADETVERGAYLHSLIWQNGKFAVRK